jgi:hypothetical protein
MRFLITIDFFYQIRYTSWVKPIAV